jgi:hypothetical protein
VWPIEPGDSTRIQHNPFFARHGCWHHQRTQADVPPKGEDGSVGAGHKSISQDQKNKPESGRQWQERCAPRDTFGQHRRHARKKKGEQRAAQGETAKPARLRERHGHSRWQEWQQGAKERGDP